MKPDTTPSPRSQQSELERSQPKYQSQPMYEVKFSVVDKQQYAAVPKDPRRLLAAFRSSEESWRHAVRAVRFAQGQIQLSLSHWQYEGVVRGLEKELSEIYGVKLQAIDEYVFDIGLVDLEPEVKEDLESLSEANHVTIVKMDKRGECWWLSVATLKDAILLQRIKKFIILDIEYGITPRIHKAKAIFCFKCSAPGHTKDECQSKKTVCGKCSAEDSHLTKQCTVQPQNYLCPLCKEDRNHVSGSSDCSYAASQQERRRAKNTKPCHPWWTDSANIDAFERLIPSIALDTALERIIQFTMSRNMDIPTMDNVQENNKLDEGGANIAGDVLKQNDALGSGDRVAGNKRPLNEMADSSLDHPPKKKKPVGRPRKTVQSDHEKGAEVKQATQKQELVTNYYLRKSAPIVDSLFEGLPDYLHGDDDSSEPETANNSFSSNP
ncbi:hypothetical protein V8C43DRAFT_321280 [Trichoderma afarasin]